MRSGGFSMNSCVVDPGISGKRMKRPALLNFSGCVEISTMSAALVIAQNGW
jgi:hypothetical protein